MPNIPILTAHGSGLASMALLAGYHLLRSFALVGPAPTVDDARKPKPAAGWIRTRLKALRRSQRRYQTIDTLAGLDDHTLRDIGLTRGVVMSIALADRRPPGLDSDMIEHRVRRPRGEPIASA